MRPSIQVAKGLRVRYYDNSILYICERPNWGDAKIAKAIKNNFPINKWEKRLIAGRMSSNMSMIAIRTHIATIRNASEVVICENNDFVKFQQRCDWRERAANAEVVDKGCPSVTANNCLLKLYCTSITCQKYL